MKRLTAALLASCACLVITTGRAGAENTSYIGINALYVIENLDEQQTQDKFTTAVQVDFDDSWGVQVRAGYLINKNFALEALYEYVAPFEATIGNFEDELDIMNFSVNGKVICTAYDKALPYLIIGVGAMNAFEDISAAGQTLETSDWGVSLRGGLGLDYFLSPNLALELEGAYTAGFGDVDHIDYTTIALGLAYHF